MLSTVIYLGFLFTRVKGSFILGRKLDFQILLDGFLLGCAKILDMVTRSPYNTRLGGKITRLQQKLLVL